MPTSEQDSFPDGCYLCEGAAGILHHISYVPEEVILLCNHCHNDVHSEGYDGGLRYPNLHPAMSRGEWKDRVWSGDWIPRPQAEQIEWDENDIGMVER
jgi:hypothetical protein